MRQVIMEEPLVRHDLSPPGTYTQGVPRQVILVESPVHLRRWFDPETGLALINV